MFSLDDNYVRKIRLVQDIMLCYAHDVSTNTHRQSVSDLSNYEETLEHTVGSDQ